MKKNKAYLPHKKYPGEKYSHSHFQHLPGSIAWVVGACLLLRHETYARVNGFDEDFFLYGEEADLALRIRKLGLEIAYFPEVIVKHMGGASERKTPTKEIWLKKQNGKQLFYQKHYAPAQISVVLSHEIKFAKRKLFLLKLKKLLRWYSHHDNEKSIRYQTVVESSTALLKALTLARNTP